MKKIIFLAFLIILMSCNIYAANGNGVALQDKNGNAITSSNPLQVHCVSGCGSGGAGLWEANNVGIDTFNTVGIGSSSPGTTLDVQGTIRASGAITGGTKFNVKNYGAKGNGVVLIDGAVATGTPTAFSSSSATFTPNVVGMVIWIQGAGAAGVDLTTTIAAYVDAHDVTLTTGASTTVSGIHFAYGIDDAAAINLTVTAANAVGGTVYFPSGVYMDNGAYLNTSAQNAQIPIPIASCSPLAQPTVSFEGESPQSPMDSVQVAINPITNGSVIFSTRNSGSGTQSVIGASNTGGTINCAFVNMSKLTIVTPSNPNETAINLFWAGGADIDYVQANAGFLDGANNVQPTNTSVYGIRMPTVNNSAWSIIRRSSAIGFYKGFQLNEHTSADDLVANGDNYCYEFGAAVQGSLLHAIKVGRILAQDCPSNMLFSSAVNVNIVEFDAEHWNFSGWRVNTADIDDASNFANGWVNYVAFKPSGGAEWNVTGGQNIIQYNLNDQGASNGIPIQNAGAAWVSLKGFNGGLNKKWWEWRSDSGLFTLNSIKDDGSAYVNQFIMSSNAAGNVGIGTSSAGALFAVGSTSQFKINSANNIITTAGNVGLGSSTPGQILDAQGTVRAISFQTLGSITGQTAYLPSNLGVGLNNPAYQLDVNGTVRAAFFIGNGSQLTNITSSQWTTANTNDVYLPSSGNVGLGTSDTTKASFRALKVGSTDYLHFDSTAAGGGNVLTVLNNGNVGIGQNTPAQALDVQGTVRAVQISITGTGITNFTGGNVGINSAAPGQILDVQGTIRTSGQMIISGIATDSGKTDATICEDTTVHQLYSGSGTLGVCLGTSTMMAKQNIVPVFEGMPQLMALKPVSFNYRSGWGYDTKKPYYGFLAEQVEPVFPRLVGRNDKGEIRNADYVGMIPIIVKGEQQLQIQIFILAGLFLFLLIRILILRR